MVAVEYGRDRALGLLEDALSLLAGRADSCEATLSSWESHLTRFADNGIHQNTSESNRELGLRCRVGDRVGRASTNRLDMDGLRDAAEQAYRVALASRGTSDAPVFAGPQVYPQVECDLAATREFGPVERARAVKSMVGRAQAAGLTAAGSVWIRNAEKAVANTSGLRAYAPSTRATVAVVAIGGTGSGYAERASRDVRRIDFDGAAESAVQTCLRSQNPVEIPPGRYEVVLLSDAVADIVATLAHMGMGARSVQDGRSFMCAGKGRQVVAECITLRDDATHPLGLAFPFDDEGVAKSRVTLIDKGVATGVVYDTVTATRDHVASTGHAVAPGALSHGDPLPSHLVMDAGPAAVDDMIRSVSHGIYVSRFHYIGSVHETRTVFTGMTRDGTFLIENGEIAKPVKNLRFTDSILRCLSTARMVGKERRTLPLGQGSVVAPALALGSFEFTGTTAY